MKIAGFLFGRVRVYNNSGNEVIFSNSVGLFSASPHKVPLLLHFAMGFSLPSLAQSQE
jgi:hypothetical protein